MKILLALGAAAAMTMASAAFAADSAIEAPIRTMETAFNKGDAKLAKSTHIAAPLIVDEVTAPFVWLGPKAFDNWIAVLGKTEAAEGKTDAHVALGAVTRETVVGDRAYVLVPSSYTFKQKGKTMRETGTMTFVLVKQAGAWKIMAWTWSSPEAVAVD